MMLKDKVAIVTGAGRGIGRGIALLMAEHGAKVVVCDYGVSVNGSEPSSEPAEAVVKEIKEKGGQAIAIADDVSNFEAGRRIVQTALDTFGRLDCLVQVAGILRERMIFNMAEDEWDDVIRVHLKGHFNLMKFATGIMRQQGSGTIITFTSVAGLEGSPGQPNYSAAKAGIVGLTRSTALAMSKYNVTINCIAPGAITRMTERLAGPVAQTKGEAGEPEDIAPLVVFLCSDQARHVTGQVYTAQGYKIALWSHPKEIRTVFNHERWTPETIAEIFGNQLGQDELSRFKRLGIPLPGQATSESGL
ncbi:MAG: SDR family oxidoreductase [Chloroflexota bacterium]|nr:MAG: SDR family oxidoreductase [Chloroflexota bacterium]